MPHRHLRGAGRTVVERMGLMERARSVALDQRGIASVREVVSKVIASTGLDLEPEELARRAGDPPQLIGNATRIGEVLGWKAEHDLDDIVDSSYPSWQADPNRPHFG